MKQGYTHIELLLDRSGSMDKIKTDMEGGIATFIKEQRAVPGEATFALRQFDDRYETVIEPIPLNEVGRIELVPRGMTALLDAMGKSITQAGEYLDAKSEDKRPEHVIFVIVTDGLENASHEWGIGGIHDLVKQQTDKYGWTFVYLGANQDAIKVGEGIGIAASNSMNYRDDNVIGTYAVASAAVTGVRSGKGPVDLPDEAS